MTNNHGWSKMPGIAMTNFEDGQYVTFSLKDRSVKVAPEVDSRLKCLCFEDDCRRVATQEDGLCNECREGGCRRAYKS